MWGDLLAVFSLAGQTKSDTMFSRLFGVIHQARASDVSIVVLHDNDTSNLFC